jgi:hypothetical protein
VDAAALRRLLRRIADTEEHEISCSECFDLVSEFVDREAAGTAEGQTFRRLRQHLTQCAVCREEYEVLRDLVELDADDDPTPPPT